MVWQRLGGRVTFATEHFRPWLFASMLEDLAHLGASLLPSHAPSGDVAPVSYHELDGSEGQLKALIVICFPRAIDERLNVYY